MEIIGKILRNQKDNQKPYIEQEQAIQWSKEIEQRDNQWQKTTHKTTDRATRTCVSSSYSTRDNTLQRKLQIEQHEPVLAVLTPLVTPVVLLLNNIIWYRNRVEHQYT